MPFFASPYDDAQLFYADYRPSTSVAALDPGADRESNTAKHVGLVFLHGWPMSSRMWDRQILPLVESHGIRCIAPDRRGFGRSEWTGTSSKYDVTYNTFADDTVALLQSIKDLRHIVFVCASMGCGESVLVQQKLDNAGLGDLCKGFVWLVPSLPYPLRTEHNQSAPPRELWNAILGGLRHDRHAFLKASIGGVFGTHAGVEMKDEALDSFIRLIERNDPVAVERCVQLISNYDFTQDLQRLAKLKGSEVPIVVIAGEDDNNWPPEAGPLRVGEIIPDAEVQVWEKAAHGLYYTHAEQVNELILRVFREASV